MLSLFKGLLSKNAITLSPRLTTLGEIDVAFAASEPVRAFNARAHVSINVSSVVPTTDAMDTIRRAEVEFPVGCIRVTAVHPDGSSTRLTKQVVGCSLAGASVSLFLEGGSSREMRFSSFVISACRDIPGASVTWFSYGK